MGYRLLLADDDRALREVIRELCAPYFEVLEAATGDAAWEIAVAEQPDLALCDFHMPGRSGLEALAALKSTDQRRPAILMTSDMSPELDRWRERALFDSLLTKPFSRRELLQTIATLIDRAYEDATFRQRLLPL